jgi:AcrR family transcriptional regulator
MTPPAERVRPLRGDAAENRERLVISARQVFAEKGLDAGVEEIARVAGVGMGTLYRRFPTKQALVDELVADVRRRLLKVGRRAQRQPDDRALETLLYDCGRLQARDPSCMQFLWSRSVAEAAAIDEFLAIVDDVHGRAQAAGRVRADVSVTDVWVALWSLRAILEMTRRHAPGAWRRHVRLLIDGMAAADAGPLTPAGMTTTQARDCVWAASR